MLVKMAECNVWKTNIGEQGAEIDTSTKTSRITKKHVIIAVTCAVVACAVIAGIVLGVKLFLDSTHDIAKLSFEFANKDGGTAKEDVTSDLADNLVQYHVESDGKQVWVINDFNRDIQLMKVEVDTGYVCFITPLNLSDAARPEHVRNATSPKLAVESVEGSMHKLEALPTPVKEKSILGPEGQKLCANEDVYWAIPTCDDQNSNLPSSLDGREKRWIFSCCYEKKICVKQLLQSCVFASLIPIPGEVKFACGIGYAGYYIFKWEDVCWNVNFCIC